MTQLVILRIHTMYPPLTHGFGATNMLTGKATILFQQHPYAQAHHRQCNQTY